MSFYIAIDEDPDNEKFYIVGIAKHLSALSDNLEFVEYEQVPDYWLDSGIYVDAKGKIKQIN